jgi:hypothetical protein
MYVSFIFIFYICLQYRPTETDDDCCTLYYTPAIRKQHLGHKIKHGMSYNTDSRYHLLDEKLTLVFRILAFEKVGHAIKHGTYPLFSVISSTLSY